MIDPDTLSSILGNLRRFLQMLAILVDLPEGEFLEDFTNVESAKHLLQVSIECCLAIAHQSPMRGFALPSIIMIKSFKSKETARILARLRSSRLPPDIQRVSYRKLRMLNNTRSW